MFFQKYWPIRTALKYASPILTIAEKPRIERHGNRPADHPCVFIIGSPRTGSTILYQLITSLLNVAYVDNLANLARNNPYSGLQLSRRLYPNRSHASYTSDFGRTTKNGLHAPAEALFIYKWFPKDRHYTELSDLTQKQLDDFRKTVRAMINRSDKPLVVKNLSFSLRIPVLRKAIPNAKYIVVRRNPLYSAQSLLLAMKAHGVADDRVWGILPRDYRKLEGLEIHEKAVRQIHMIESQIHEDLKGLAGDDLLYVDYEKLGSGLEVIIDQVKSLLGPGVRRRPDVPIPQITVKNKMNLPEKEFELLTERVRPLNWKLYN